ncbi:MAG TPA: glycosyltransferase [Allosphingosinicella sp.]|nr:glycosyltransferase [Allosphingosinicella sp.]
MLRVLTLATLFPSGARPTLGVFVERQAQGLAAVEGVALEVVAPIGLPAGPLARHPHYNDLRALPEREVRNGLIVHRPRYRVAPWFGQSRTARAIAEALMPMIGEIQERFPFDVIDAEFFWPDGPVAMRLARALGAPFSIKARGGDIDHWGKRPAIARQIVEAAAAADGLLAVSEALRGDMALLGIDPAKVKVHRTGIDLDRFRPGDRAAAKQALGVTGPLLVTAGALIPRKGQAVAIAALARIPQAVLLIVGGGPDRPKLERLARERGVAERVRFLGSRPHEELPGLLAAADVMVLPTAFEGIANVWVESLACGTPVVTCDVGGAREAIDRPEAGRLVTRNEGAVAQAVGELLADQPDPAEVRKAAERFSWDRNAAELRDHLAGLVR